MGSTPFFKITDSYSPRLGYDSLVSEAISRHGDDPYNGTISTCRYAGVSHKIDAVYKKGAEEIAAEYVDSHDNGVKWEARAIDLGVVEYQVIRYKNIKIDDDNRPKFQPKFVLVDECGTPISNERFETAGEAKRAIPMLLKKFDILPYTISVVKEYSLVSGDPTMAKREAVVKTYKRRPKQVPTGGILKEVHRYAFYGWAGC